MRSIEMFAGAGGLGIGISRSGFKPAAVLEWDQNCCDTIRENKNSGIESVQDWPVFQGDVRDFETQLIRHYGGAAAVQWNGSGFGSNDPGKERNTSAYKDTHFDAMYPIDIDTEIQVDLSECESAAEILSALKAHLPYTFRFESTRPRSREPHSDLVSTNVVKSTIVNRTARNVIELVVKQLPEGWQATLLPSHIILYKEDKRSFPHGKVIAYSSAPD